MKGTTRNLLSTMALAIALLAAAWAVAAEAPANAALQPPSHRAAQPPSHRAAQPPSDAAARTPSEDAPQPSMHATAKPASPDDRKLDPAPPVDDASIYQLESRWTRSDGEKVALSSLRGKVRVLAIFYSTCEVACPVIIGRMRSIQAMLDEPAKKETGFVLVTMDPEHDNPARLAEYAKKMKFEGDWTLLQSSDGDVRELAALLGFRYRAEQDGEFAHSNMISVLDREGRLAFQSIGLESDVAEAVKAVKGLTAR